MSAMLTLTERQEREEKLGKLSYDEKCKLLRIELMTWKQSELWDVIRDSLSRPEQLVDLILEDDLLGGEMDGILIDAGRFEVPRLCGGAENPQAERALYESAMQGQAVA